MQPAETIASIRKFNRFYAQILGVFDRYALHTNYSLAQARILGELGRRKGCTANSIARQLDMDRSYAARIINQFAQQGLLKKTADTSDCRKKLLYLTDSGEQVFHELEIKSNEKVRLQLQNIPPGKWTELQKAMQSIESVFTAFPQQKLKRNEDDENNGKSDNP